MVMEKSGNLRKKEENLGKVREFDRLSEDKSFATPHVQLDDLSLWQNTLPRSHGKFFEVRK